MASEFLKKKAAQQRERVAEKYGTNAYGAARQDTQPEAKKEEGAVAPSSGKASTKASSFLKNKAQEQARQVSEKYGEDAYGGIKWRSKRDNTLTSESLSSLLQQVKGLGTAKTTGSDTLRTSGGYYSRPLSGGDTGGVLDKVNALTPAMRAFSVQVQEAGSALEEAEGKLRIVENYRTRALSAYQTAPSDGTAETYNKIEAAYKQAESAYTAAHSEYSRVYSEYMEVEDQVREILDAYQYYADTEKAKIDFWRGTIRDEQAIQTDIQQLDGQIREQEDKDRKSVV